MHYWVIKPEQSSVAQWPVFILPGSSNRLPAPRLRNDTEWKRQPPTSHPHWVRAWTPRETLLGTRSRVSSAVASPSGSWGGVSRGSATRFWKWFGKKKRSPVLLIKDNGFVCGGTAAASEIHWPKWLQSLIFFFFFKAGFLLLMGPKWDICIIIMMTIMRKKLSGLMDGNLCDDWWHFTTV